MHEMASQAQAGRPQKLDTDHTKEVRSSYGPAHTSLGTPKVWLQLMFPCMCAFACRHINVSKDFYDRSLHRKALHDLKQRSNTAGPPQGRLNRLAHAWATRWVRPCIGGMCMHACLLACVHCEGGGSIGGALPERGRLRGCCPDDGHAAWLIALQLSWTGTCIT
eukprot:358066-Chlamydomonas_euryale.AAC.5